MFDTPQSIRDFLASREMEYDPMHQQSMEVAYRESLRREKEKMNADQNTVEDCAFTLRELRRIRTDNAPDDVDTLFSLLEMRARDQINRESFKRQAQEIEKRMRQADE